MEETLVRVDWPTTSKYPDDEKLVELTFCMDALLAVTRSRSPEMVVEARVDWVRPKRLEMLAVVMVEEERVEEVMTAEASSAYVAVDVEAVLVAKVAVSLTSKEEASVVAPKAYIVPETDIFPLASIYNLPRS